MINCSGLFARSFSLILDHSLIIFLMVKIPSTMGLNFFCLGENPTLKFEILTRICPDGKLQPTSAKFHQNRSGDSYSSYTVLFEAIPTLLKTTSDLLQTYYRVVFPEFKTGAKCTVWGQDNVTGNGKLAEWAALRYSISCASQ